MLLPVVCLALDGDQPRVFELLHQPLTSNQQVWIEFLFTARHDAPLVRKKSESEVSAVPLVPPVK